MTAGLDPITRVPASLSSTANVYEDTAYASLSDAVTVIGSAVSTLRISTSLFPNGATCTVPATLLIEWVGAGSLTITTGQTVIVVSSGDDWPMRKLFYNCLTGQGTISFGGTSTRYYIPHWLGVVGDATVDDTAALQTFVDRMPNKAAIFWPRGFECKITEPLRIWTKRELSFISPSGTYYPDTFTGIYYQGADGTEAVQIYNSFGILWDGIKIKANYGANVAHTGIDIDQFPDATVIDGRAIAGQVCSNNTVRNTNVLTENNGVNFTAMRLAYTSWANCEMMRYENVSIYVNGTSYNDPSITTKGTAFKIGGNGGGGNVLNIVYERCIWVGASYGIEATGQVSASNCESQYALVDFKLTGDRPHLLVNNRSENQRRFFEGRGTVTMIANQIALGGWLSGTPNIKATGPAKLLLIGNNFDTPQAGVISVDNDPAHANTIGLWGNTNLSLDSPPYKNFSTAVEMGTSQSTPLRIYGGAIGGASVSAGNFQFVSDITFGGTAIQFKNASDVAIGSIGNIGAFQGKLKVAYNAAGTICDFVGFNSPEGVCTADPGSTYRRENGAAGTFFYVKESGTGNTGWVPYTGIVALAAAHLLAGADNTYDIGASGATRPRTGYFGTSLRTPKFETAAAVQWTSGAGSPEGVVTANVGSLYTRTDGGAATTLYIKESGTGNTGWVAK